MPIDCMLRISPGADKLIIMFHGAVDRSKRTIPIFSRFIPEIANAHQISFADPTLAVDGELRVGWFAGREGFDAQTLIAEAISGIVATLTPERTIYFGGSGGGFAALYFAHQQPGSVVVAANPQTNFLRYYISFITRYRETCWPDARDNGELSDLICTDVGSLYRTGVPNTVVFMQSMGDPHHYERHMLPFASAVADAPNAGRVLFHSYFDGQFGHTASASVLDWVKAVCTAETTEPKDILASWHALGRTGTVAPTSRPAPLQPQDHATPQDLPDQRISMQLREWFATRGAELAQ